MAIVLLLILILLMVGGLPTWNYSANWGFGPSGLLTVLIIVLLFLLVTGRL